jgi:general stress protein 26
MKPQPESIAPEELLARARLVLQSDPAPMLATIDGDQPRLRPVSPVKVEDFTVYVANLRSFHKTQEIAANPNVELCYLANNDDQVRITGVAEIVTDRGLLQAIWDENALLRQYLGSIDNPELIVYRIRPTRVRYMQEWGIRYYEMPVDG